MDDRRAEALRLPRLWIQGLLAFALVLGCATTLLATGILLDERVGVTLLPK